MMSGVKINFQTISKVYNNVVFCWSPLIYAVKIDPLINTNPIITYKVIIPSLNKLEQGNMFTGIFRSSENS